MAPRSSPPVQIGQDCSVVCLNQEDSGMETLLEGLETSEHFKGFQKSDVEKRLILTRKT